MEITGKIINVMQVITGNGKKGTWHKQDFILEQPGQFPKPVCISVWGEDLINKYDLTVGLTVTAHINIESREYSGRWFTDVKAWKITWEAQSQRKWQSAGTPPADPDAGKYPEPNSSAAPSSNLDSDSLPF